MLVSDRLKHAVLALRSTGQATTAEPLYPPLNRPVISITLIVGSHHRPAMLPCAAPRSFDGFVSFTEAVMGQDFVVFVRSIMPRTIMEIVMQARPGAHGGVDGACMEG